MNENNLNDVKNWSERRREKENAEVREMSCKRVRHDSHFIASLHGDIEYILEENL